MISLQASPKRLQTKFPIHTSKDKALQHCNKIRIPMQSGNDLEKILEIEERKCIRKILRPRKTLRKSHIQKFKRNNNKIYKYEKCENVITEEKTHLLWTRSKN